MEEIVMLENRYSEGILKEYKPLYYYCRDEINRPWITVCLLWKMIEGIPVVFSRGVSICSHLDNICKSWGRGLALERAMLAAVTHNDSEEIDKSANNNRISHVYYSILPFEFIFKSEYEPDLTTYEQKVIDRISLKYN
jgi:hypothetical protein